MSDVVRSSIPRERQASEHHDAQILVGIVNAIANWVVALAVLGYLTMHW